MPHRSQGTPHVPQAWGVEIDRPPSFAPLKGGGGSKSTAPSSFAMGGGGAIDFDRSPPLLRHGGRGAVDFEPLRSLRTQEHSNLRYEGQNTSE